MRFGKKLALQVIDDISGAPYLSHRPMKEAINRTVRELRLYQAKLQSWQDGGAGVTGHFPCPATAQEELVACEKRIADYDRELFVLIDNDLVKIQRHIRMGEQNLHRLIANLQAKLIEAGLLIEESQLKKFESALLQKTDSMILCQTIIELRIRSDPMAAANDFISLADDYAELSRVAGQHGQYMEINVAGFRKLLKRHEKQIPPKFRSSPTPCLEFHRLVTHTSRSLLDFVGQVRHVLVDARARFTTALAPDQASDISRTLDELPELQENQGLGPECRMVLEIQGQLKNPVVGGSLVMYPKPGPLSLDSSLVQQANCFHGVRSPGWQNPDNMTKGPTRPSEGPFITPNVGLYQPQWFQANPLQVA